MVPLASTIALPADQIHSPAGVVQGEIVEHDGVRTACERLRNLVEPIDLHLDMRRVPHLLADVPDRTGQVDALLRRARPDDCP